MTDRNMYGPEILIGVMINEQFTTDDKKDKYAKTTTDPRGSALLLMSLLSPAVARYDSVYQLLTAFTSNHQVLTAFINGKCRFFFFHFWDPFPLNAMQNSMTQPK